MNQRNETICPRCGRPAMRPWNELSDQDRDVFERLNPQFRDETDQANIRICTRCWFADGPELVRV